MFILMLFKLKNLMIGWIACFSNNLQYKENTLVSMLVKGSLHKCHNGTCIKNWMKWRLMWRPTSLLNNIVCKQADGVFNSLFSKSFSIFHPIVSPKVFNIIFLTRHFWHTLHSTDFHYKRKINLLVEYIMDYAGNR